AGTYRYDTFTFQNTSSTDNCYQVTLDPKSCEFATTNELHSSAYLGAFNPANVCSNRLGDIGFSSGDPLSYPFVLPPGPAATVVVNEGPTNATCSNYKLTMPAIDPTDAGGCSTCSPATPSPTASN